jgi:hypothetical protein
MNNRETASRHQTLAIRKARTKSASASAMQTSPAGVSFRPPIGNQALVVAIAGAARLSISRHTNRTKQQRPRITEAFVACP